MGQLARKKTERLFTNITDMRHFAEKLREFSERTAYRYFIKKDLHEMTYGELADLFLKEAAGLEAVGLAGKRVAVIGDTSPEWVSSYVSIIAGGGVDIPMDKELEVGEIAGFLNYAEADAIIYSRSLNEKFKELPEKVTTVSYFIPMEPLEGWEENPKILPLANLLEKGEEGVKNGYHYPETDDIDRMAEMLFTSGTTGTSKCVMLSQRNIFAAVNSACGTVEFGPDDRIVSVLPIHHTYELCIMLAGLNYGMNIAINDSIKHVLKNFAFFKPTGLVLVPLFVSTMYKKIWDEARKGKREKKLKAGIGLSRFLRALRIDVRRKLFKEVLDAFGGSLNKIICGGAPLNPDFVKVFTEFGIEIYEGYGITECSPLVAVSPYYAPKPCSVGPSVPACEVMIDICQQNDKGFDEGEILVKGDNVMMGYYHNDEENAKVFTEDGWFRTGDIGYLDKDGYIFITGRKKNLIIADNGKNVYPEEIEEYLADIPGIAECVVVARKNEESDTVITALVYPDDQVFKGVAKEEIYNTIYDAIGKMNRDLVPYKQVRGLELRDEPFEKTTSRKIKRHLVK